MWMDQADRSVFSLKGVECLDAESSPPCLNVPLRDDGRIESRFAHCKVVVEEVSTETPSSELDPFDDI